MQQAPFILVLAIYFFTACDKPDCEVTNLVFTQHRPESREYQAELVRLLKNQNLDQLSYWLDEFVVLEEQECLKVNIQGDGICAVAILKVKKWDDKIAGIKRTKGESYEGAELKGLAFDIEENGDSPKLVYENLDRIID